MENDKVKISNLLTCIEQKDREIYESFNFDNPGDKMRLSPALLKFSEYCNPRKNITIIRQKFFTYLQHEGQNFHDFVTELKRLGSKCEFESLYDYFMKDVIVCGTNDKSLRKHLLGESELTQYLLDILPKRLVSMPAKYLRQVRPSVCTGFQNT